MSARIIRFSALLSLATVIFLLVVANLFHAAISESQVATYAHLGAVSVAMLATAYFLPRAIGTLFRSGRRTRR